MPHSGTFLIEKLKFEDVPCVQIFILYIFREQFDIADLSRRSDSTLKHYGAGKIANEGVFASAEKVRKLNFSKNLKISNFLLKIKEKSKKNVKFK